MAPIIRAERPGDAAAIRAVLLAAFGRSGEADLVERLRADGDVALSLVAEAAGGIVGHILFTPLTAPFRALGLGPLAVAPAWQGRGIGSALSRAGLDSVRGDGWQGVFVLGDPVYYTRFGFRVAAAAGFECSYAGPHFMAMPLAGRLLASQGPVACAPAFAGLD